MVKSLTLLGAGSDSGGSAGGGPVVVLHSSVVRHGPSHLLQETQLCAGVVGGRGGNRCAGTATTGGTAWGDKRGLLKLLEKLIKKVNYLKSFPVYKIVVSNSNIWKCIQLDASPKV